MQHHFDTLMYCMCVGLALSVSVVNAYRLLFDLRVYGASILQLHCTESESWGRELRLFKTAGPYKSALLVDVIVVV